MANSDISGQITDGSGNPIPSAEVYLWREDLAGAGGVVASTTADSTGNFAFTAHPDGSGSSESWHVAAKDPNANVQLQSAYGVTASPPTSVDSQFDVSITDTSPSPVSPGETLTVDASLTNSGTDQDTQTITLEINNSVGQVDSTSVTVTGGGSTTQTLSWSVPSGQTDQGYTATVSSDDDTASQTVTVGSAIPVNIVDDFEDNGITEYTGDTGGYVTATSAVEGSYALAFDSASGGGATIRSTSGLNYYPKKGDKFSCLARSVGGDSLPELGFGGASGVDGYVVGFYPPLNEVRVRKYSGGSPNDLASKSASLSTGTWYDVEVQWHDGSGSEADNTI